MDATQPPSKIQLIIWNIITITLVALIAYTTQPPCDKPIKTHQRVKSELEESSNMAAASTVRNTAKTSGCWNTAQGDTVNYLFKPTASACTLILVLETDTPDNQLSQQTLEIKLSGNNDLLPDTQAIQPLVKLLGSQYTLNALHISIEGAIEEQKAKDMADRVSLTLH